MAAIADISITDVGLTKADSTLTVSMKIEPNGERLRSDRDITYSPLIIGDGESLCLPAFVIAGRNRYLQMERKGCVEGRRVYRDGVPFDYSVCIPYKEWMEHIELQIEKKPCRCGAPYSREPEESVSKLAVADFSPREIVPLYAFMLPEGKLEKFGTAEGSAYIDFRVNRTEIDPLYRRNPSELSKIKATIDKVLNDSDVNITGIRIKGFASPEGSFENNVRLASGRARTLAEYVRKLYSLSEGMMKISSEPENWDGLRLFIAESDLADKEKMLQIIDNQSLEPDAREAALKKAFPTDYAFLLKNVYPGLRRSDYAVEYKVRNFTSIEEIKRIMKTAPEKLSVNEVFAVANTLDPQSPEFTEALVLAYKIDGDMPETNLNMAVLALRNDNPGLAAPFLAKAGESPEADYARGILAYLEDNLREAAGFFGKAAASGLKEAMDAESQLQKISRPPTTETN